MPVSLPAATRRRAITGVLGGVLGGALLGTASACGETAPGARAAAPSAPAPGADDRLLDDVRAAVAAQEQLVSAAMTAHRDLREALRPARDLHRAHLEVLESAVPGDPGTRAPRRPAAALAGVRRGEAGLQRALGRGAVEAAGGELAQVLASMSAAVAQLVATLPAAVPGTPR